MEQIGEDYESEPGGDLLPEDWIRPLQKRDEIVPRGTREPFGEEKNHNVPRETDRANPQAESSHRAKELYQVIDF